MNQKTNIGAMFLKQALMISVRYCAVRRQGISPQNPKIEQSKKNEKNQKKELK